MFNKYFLVFLYFILLWQAEVLAVNSIQAISQPTNNAVYSRNCPEAQQLVNVNGSWTSRDGGWKSFTKSTANKITGFVGAQWAGVKLGKVICLYTTNEAVSFPLAVEQVGSQSVLEPKTYAWSALTKEGRRFCKSASTADCLFILDIQKQLNTNDIYNSIKYNPTQSM